MECKFYIFFHFENFLHIYKNYNHILPLSPLLPHSQFHVFLFFLHSLLNLMSAFYMLIGVGHPLEWGEPTSSYNKKKRKKEKERKKKDTETEMETKAETETEGEWLTLPQLLSKGAAWHSSMSQFCLDWTWAGYKCFCEFMATLPMSFLEDSIWEHSESSSLYILSISFLFLYSQSQALLQLTMVPVRELPLNIYVHTHIHISLKDISYLPTLFCQLFLFIYWKWVEQKAIYCSSMCITNCDERA